MPGNAPGRARRPRLFRTLGCPRTAKKAYVALGMRGIEPATCRTGICAQPPARARARPRPAVPRHRDAVAPGEERLWCAPAGPAPGAQRAAPAAGRGPPLPLAPCRRAAPLARALPGQCGGRPALPGPLRPPRKTHQAPCLPLSPPSRPPSEWPTFLHIPHSPEAVVMGQEVANFFVREARRNQHAAVGANRRALPRASQGARLRLENAL
jgi:hypothetical protein